MPYDSTGAGSYIKVVRINPITSDFIGDLTKGGNNNLSAFTDIRRSVKGACRAATTANITLSAPQTIDGVAVVAGDRVLVKNQTTASANGIYVVAAGAWTRATDFDVSAEAIFGSRVPVVSGTTQAGTFWMMTTTGAITLGTTSLTFTQVATNALTVTGLAPATAATANTLAARDANANIFAANHASLGTAGAAGTAIVADATGSVPFAAFPPALLSAITYGQNEATTTGLTWGYYGGPVVLTNGTSTTISNGTVALTNNTTNYVQVDPATGTVSVNTTGFTSGYRWLAKVVTSAGAITTITDVRDVSGAGGGGSSTTSAQEFASMFAIGDLTGFVGLDFVDTWIAVSAANLARILVTADKTPASGNLTIELRKRSGGGALASGSTTLITGSSITLAANGGKAFSVTAITPVALAANDIVLVKITASASGFEDLRVGLFA